MTSEIPQYALRAFALFFTKHGSKESFKQSELDWIVSSSMKKKIFAILLKNGWLKKESRNTYICLNPEMVLRSLLDFKVSDIIKKSKKPYAFTNLSAIEIWSDFSYIQRGIERSPYFIKILKKDLKYWKHFFNSNNIPNFINNGSEIGEYVILLPELKINHVEKDGLKVESLRKTFEIAKRNEMYSYPHTYMRRKYGSSAA